jgi:hypothetical protein
MKLFASLLKMLWSNSSNQNSYKDPKGSFFVKWAIREELHYESAGKILKIPTALDYSNNESYTICVYLIKGKLHYHRPFGTMVSEKEILLVKENLVLAFKDKNLRFEFVE